MRGAMRDLFDPQAYPNGPGHRGVDTSIAAAESMRPHVSKLQGKILAYLRARSTEGATYEQICEGCDLKTPTVCGRMVELVEAGHVVIAADTRKTRSGRSARIYLLAPEEGR